MRPKTGIYSLANFLLSESTSDSASISEDWERSFDRVFIISEAIFKRVSKIDGKLYDINEIAHDSDKIRISLSDPDEAGKGSIEDMVDDKEFIRSAKTSILDALQQSKFPDDKAFKVLIQLTDSGISIGRQSNPKNIESPGYSVALDAMKKAAEDIKNKVKGTPSQENSIANTNDMTVVISRKGEF